MGRGPAGICHGMAHSGRPGYAGPCVAHADSVNRGTGYAGPARSCVRPHGTRLTTGRAVVREGDVHGVSAGTCHGPSINLPLLIGTSLAAALVVVVVARHVRRRIRARHGSVGRYVSKKRFDLLYHGRRLNLIAPEGARSPPHTHRPGPRGLRGRVWERRDGRLPVLLPK